MTEFIENPADKATKQDCELKAFYRLAERLKARFPRLPILLSMDGLFAGGPTFSLCCRYGWKFMIVLKDDDLPSVNEEFDALSKLRPENRLVWRTGKQAQVKQVFRWVDDIAYGDSEKKEHPLSAIECLKALERLTPLYIKQGVGMASFAGNPVVFILLHKGADGFMSDEQFETFYWPTLKALILGLATKDVCPFYFVRGLTTHDWSI